jgi:hypothetical protein
LLATRTRSRLILLFLLCVATRTHAQDARRDSSVVLDSASRVSHGWELPTVGIDQRGLWFLGGLHFGAPAGVSAGIGPALGLAPHLPGSLYAEAEPGIVGMRYNAGYLLKENRSWIGFSVSAVQLRAWRSALGADRGVTYRGGQASVLFAMFNLRVASMAAVGGRSGWLTTVDFGVGP